MLRQMAKILLLTLAESERGASSFIKDTILKIKTSTDFVFQAHRPKSLLLTASNTTSNFHLTRPVAKCTVTKGG